METQRKRMGRPRVEGAECSVQVSLRLTKEMKEEMDRVAKERGVKPATFIRQAVRNALQNPLEKV